MRFTNTLLAVTLAVVLVLASPIAAQGHDNATAPGAAAPAATAGSAGDVTKMLADLPACFTACATTAATSKTVGCKSLTDLACVCANKQMPNATNTCITTSSENNCGDVAKNKTALNEANQLFTAVCKAVSSAGGVAASGAAATDGTAKTPTSGTSTSTSGHSGATHLAPYMQHIIATAVVMSALLVGATTLL